MRNAAARLDDEFGYDQPVSKSKPRPKTAAAKSKKRTAGRPRKNKSRYIRYAAVGLTAALTIGIMINALALQNSKHPAPLFGKAIQLGDQPAAMMASSAAPTAPLPAPPSRPAAEPEAAPAPAAAVTHDNAAPAAHLHHAAVDATAHHPKPSEKADDPIADLLKVSAPGGAAEKPKDNPKTVLAAQHALLKLGYVVSPDGTFGQTTRTAIQAFEREQHLPISAELSRKLLKQLSAESGIAID